MKTKIWMFPLVISPNPNILLSKQIVKNGVKINQLRKVFQMNLISNPFRFWD